MLSGRRSGAQKVMAEIPTTGPSYVADMRAEAQLRRDEAATQSGHQQEWTLSRAAFFDACADEEDRRDDR